MKKKLILGLVPLLIITSCSAPDEITSIEVTDYQKEYALNEELDKSSFKVEAVYSSGKRVDISDLVSINDIDTSTYGEKNVDISYDEFKITTKVDVDLIKMSLPSSLGGEEYYDYSFPYKYSFFDSDTTTFNKELSLLSLGYSVSNLGKEKMDEFIQKMQFDNVYYSSNYDGKTSMNSINYVIAHKEINNSNIIAISVKGFGYGNEWAGNFYVGDGIEEKNHLGFSIASNSLIEGIKEYINKHQYENMKIWITGYSRAGAVVNMSTTRIIENNEINIDEKDFYIYTFEAPRGLSESNAKDYQIIHNVINSSDMITRLLPSEYGLYRSGIDVDIYPGMDKIDGIVNTIYPNYLPKFNPTDKFDNDIKFVEYLFSILLSEDNVPLLNNRENYFNNYQAGLTNIIDLVLSLKKETLDAIVTDVMDLYKNNLFELLTIVTDANKMFEFINPYIKEDGIIYSEEDLKNSCETIINIIGFGLPLVSLIATKGIDPMLRLIKMHTPEVIYPILKDFVYR